VKKFVVLPIGFNAYRCAVILAQGKEWVAIVSDIEKVGVFTG